MGMLKDLRSVFESGSKGEADHSAEETIGTYWCHDCGEREPVSTKPDASPACPSCGEVMSFERAPPAAGCAC